MDFKLSTPHTLLLPLLLTVERVRDDFAVERVRHDLLIARVEQFFPLSILVIRLLDCSKDRTEFK